MFPPRRFYSFTVVYSTRKLQYQNYGGPYQCAALQQRRPNAYWVILTWLYAAGAPSFQHLWDCIRSTESSLGLSSTRNTETYWSRLQIELDDLQRSLITSTILWFEATHSPRLSWHHTVKPGLVQDCDTHSNLKINQAVFSLFQICGTNQVFFHSPFKTFC